MFNMAVGQSDDVDALEAVRDVIGQCRTRLRGQTPRAGILLVAFDSFDARLQAEVRGAFPGMQLIGSTSAAQMSSDSGYHEDAVTLAVFATDQVDITAGAGARVDMDPVAACRAAVDQALAGTDKQPRLCVMLLDALGAELALDEVRAALPSDVVLVGGASSGTSLRAPRPNYQFSNDDVVEDGVALLLFSGPLAFSVAVGTGLRPIGPTGVVTRSEYGAIHEIDGRPAMKFIEQYMHEPGPATYGNPLAVQEEGSSDSYHRVLIGHDPTSGSLFIPGSLPVGARVQLTTAGTDEIIAATSDIVRQATKSFPSGATPTAALLFSCAIRKFLLGTRTGLELAGAQKLLPEGVAVAGMYCGGEIGPVGDGPASRFHTETFIALLLGA